MSKLREILQLRNVLVADGAMATSLYDSGFYINRSFEELSLTEPQAVRDVIRKFKKAGAQIFHTNTFNATRPKLTKYGLQSQLTEIVQKSVELTRDTCGPDGFVLGLMGPLGVLVEPLGPTSLQEAEDMFYEIASALDQSQVDGFALNGLHDFNEVICGIRAIRRVSQKPIFVNIGINESLRTLYGHSLKDLAALGEKYNLDVIGICGEIGPSTMLTAIEELTKHTHRPIMALPNAGLPRYVNDQYIYLCNPDYIGKFAKRFIQAGALIVGGHSGVYDTHIQAIKNAVRMVGAGTTPTHRSSSHEEHKSASRLPETIKPISDEPMPTVPLSKRSRLGQALADGDLVLSIELVPPTLNEFDKFLARCRELEAAKVPFVNIPDGARAMARISSFHLAAHIKKNFSMEPIPHFTCRDRNLIGLQSDLLGAHISSVHNLLLVTGDPPKLGNNPGASAVYDVDAIGLTHIVSRLNRGLDVGGARTDQQTQYVTGVALNPTTKNSDLEVSRFRYKIEAGADYAITQPIYNVDAYKKFLDQVGATQIPIIMGIWPLVSLRNAEFLKYEVPGVDVPDWVIEEMQKAGDSKEEALKRGVEIAVRTIEEAKGLVAGFQVSAPFNRVSVATQVMQNATLMK